MPFTAKIAWPHEASRRVKAAVTARFGKGWSVRHGRGTASAHLYIEGPKGVDGCRAIPDEHNAALAAALGRATVPRGGATVSCVEWERLVSELEAAERPPDEKKARNGENPAGLLQSDSRNGGIDPNSTPAYCVEIVAPSGRVTVWGVYRDRATAEAEAAKVCKIGMLAAVRPIASAPTTAP